MKDTLLIAASIPVATLAAVATYFALEILASLVLGAWERITIWLRSE